MVPFANGKVNTSAYLGSSTFLTCIHLKLTSSAFISGYTSTYQRQIVVTVTNLCHGTFFCVSYPRCLPFATECFGLDGCATNLQPPVLDSSATANPKSETRGSLCHQSTQPLALGDCEWIIHRHHVIQESLPACRAVLMVTTLQYRTTNNRISLLVNLSAIRDSLGLTCGFC